MREPRRIRRFPSGGRPKTRPFRSAPESSPYVDDTRTAAKFTAGAVSPIRRARLSGDSDGQEILAILEEVLDSGFVHLDAGTPQELYVWPYFFAMPLDRLDAKQRVELFKIVTAGDYDDMKQFGAYIFYRVGITPQGKWAFFVAGD